MTPEEETRRILTLCLLVFTGLMALAAMSWFYRYRRRTSDVPDGESGSAAPIICFVAGLVFCFIVPFLGWILILASFASAARAAFSRTPPRLTSHGSARFASWRDLLLAGMLQCDGLILGRADRLQGRPNDADPNTLIRVNDFVHLATFAPTGSGKGVSVVIPTLLTYEKSVVVTDPKGENFKLTADYRFRHFGQPILRLDPFGVCGSGGDSINPLDLIDENSEQFIDQCRDLANFLVFRQGSESEPHWNDSAQKIIHAFIAFVCACTSHREHRTLSMVRSITSSPAKYFGAIELMQAVTENYHGVIALLGDQLTWYRDEELDSVLSTVQRHLEFLDSPAVARFLSHTSLDLNILRSHRGASVYVILKPDRIESMPGLNRLLVGSLLRWITQGTPTEENKVLFLLDEAASLGRLNILEEAVTYLRGSGIRIWFIYQSLNQVHKAYGDNAGTILDNIDTCQFFGTNDLQTAQTVSQRMGNATIAVGSTTHTVGYTQPMHEPFGPRQPGSRNVSTATAISPHGRPLLSHDETLGLLPSTAIIFHRHLPPILATLVRYYDAPEFQEYRDFTEGVTTPRIPSRSSGGKLKTLKKFGKAAAFAYVAGVAGILAVAALKVHFFPAARPTAKALPPAEPPRVRRAVPEAPAIERIEKWVPQPKATPLTLPERITVRQKAPSPPPVQRSAPPTPGQFPTTITPRERIYPLPDPPPPPFRLGGSGYSPR